MNIYYISPRDMRKNRADPVHTMYTCKVLSELGWNVTLVTPRVLRKDWTIKKSEIWGLYNDMKPVFRITELPTYIDDVNERITIERIVKFICFTIYYLVKIRSLNSRSIIYAHCYISVLPAIILKNIGLLKSRIYYEKADYFPDKSSHNYILNNVDGIIAINEYIKSNSLRSYSINDDDIIKLPFTSQADQFRKVTSNYDSNTVRDKLGLDRNKIYITYSGKLSDNSLEVKYILESTKYIRGNNIVFLFVGGTSDAVVSLQRHCNNSNIDNAVFVGYQSLSNLYLYVHASDILISYYDTLHETHIYQRVPAKLGVYLSASKPLILADLPCLREWWSDEQVFYVKPDSPELLAGKINYVLNNPKQASLMAYKCKQYAEVNTYEKAYKIISAFLLNKQIDD